MNKKAIAGLMIGLVTPWFAQAAVYDNNNCLIDSRLNAGFRFATVMPSGPDKLHVERVIRGGKSIIFDLSDCAKPSGNRGKLSSLSEALADHVSPNRTHRS